MPKGKRDTKKGPDAGDKDKKAGRRTDSRKLPLRIQRKRNRILGSKGIRTRRRHPEHRLERNCTPQRTICKRIHRRTQPLNIHCLRHLRKCRLRLLKKQKRHGMRDSCINHVRSAAKQRLSRPLPVLRPRRKIHTKEARQKTHPEMLRELVYYEPKSKKQTSKSHSRTSQR